MSEDAKLTPEQKAFLTEGDAQILGPEQVPDWLRDMRAAGQAEEQQSE